MSDDLTKDLEISLKLLLGKRMKEALLSGDTEEARKWAAKLQEAEDEELVRANSSQTHPHGNAPQKRGQPPTMKKDYDGKWIN